MTKFTVEILSRYGIHFSLVSSVCMPCITHFEFICMAQNLIPTFEMFNVFYYVVMNVRSPPKRLYDWKHKFFFIRCGVIPIEMQFSWYEDRVPKEKVITYEGMPWYEALTSRLAPMWHLEEDALVAAGMSISNTRFFYHPSDESIASFAHVRSGAHLSILVKPETVDAPSGEQITILSSEESVALFGERLIARSYSVHAGADEDNLGDRVFMSMW
ncbi:hypothetical protein Hanom_Chr01g00033281 [Helianthus anomalus]